MPAPWMPAWSLPLAHIYKAQYSPIDASGGLPASLHFRTSERAIAQLRNGEYATVSDVTQSERDRALVQLAYFSKLPEPEAVYQVTRLTNCGGVVLPAECYLEMYRFGFTTNGTTKAVAWRIQCETDFVKSIDSISALPKHEDQIQDIGVADYRFFEKTKNVYFLRYTVTNFAWITNESDPFLQQVLSRASVAGKTRDSGKLPKTVPAILLVSLVLCPLLLKQTRQLISGALRGVWGK
jgi:hypothetical protein